MSMIALAARVRLLAKNLEVLLLSDEETVALLEGDAVSVGRKSASCGLNYAQLSLCRRWRWSCSSAFSVVSTSLLLQSVVCLVVVAQPHVLCMVSRPFKHSLVHFHMFFGSVSFLVARTDGLIDHVLTSSTCHRARSEQGVQTL
jgi:hypothetical protein